MFCRAELAKNVPEMNFGMRCQDLPDFVALHKVVGVRAAALIRRLVRASK